MCIRCTTAVCDECELVKRALRKLQADFDWRGPSGKPQSILTLPRDDAEAILQFVRDVWEQREQASLNRVI